METTLSPELTDSNNATDLSRPRRYRVLPEQSIPVAIERFDEEEPASGELIDVSVAGARLRSKTPMRFGETLVLHLESEASGISITISCRVQWIRSSRAQEEWIVGCRFAHDLEDHLLEDYVERGLLERREVDRFDISLPASVRFEISGEDADVEMTNIGTGGFCFLSLSAGRIGSRVCARMNQEENDTVEGRIMWHSLRDGMYLIGCQWVNRKGIDFAKQLNDRRATAKRRPWSRTVVLLAAGGVIAAIAFALGTMLR